MKNPLPFPMTPKEIMTSGCVFSPEEAIKAAKATAVIDPVVARELTDNITDWATRWEKRGCECHFFCWADGSRCYVVCPKGRGNDLIFSNPEFAFFAYRHAISESGGRVLAVFDALNGPQVVTQ